jgi:hypothetical protein
VSLLARADSLKLGQLGICSVRSNTWRGRCSDRERRSHLKPTVISAGVFVFGLVSCGPGGPDPRDAFVGPWSRTSVWLWDGRPMAQNAEQHDWFTISDLVPSSDFIQWVDSVWSAEVMQPDRCTQTAELVPDAGFSLYPARCSLYGGFADCEGRSFDFKEGHGELSGDSLTLSESGDYAFLCWGETIQGTFTLTVTATR